MQSLLKTESFRQFMRKIDREFVESRLYEMSDYIYYLPEGTQLERSVHYIRTGLLLGRVRNDNFEPSQALAMELDASEWDNPLCLDIGDDRVMRYLKCETIEADDNYDGYRLVCVNNHTLGWVKQTGTRCKNKYYPGWRYN